MKWRAAGSRLFIYVLPRSTQLTTVVTLRIKWSTKYLLNQGLSQLFHVHGREKKLCKNPLCPVQFGGVSKAHYSINAEGSAGSVRKCSSEMRLHCFSSKQIARSSKAAPKISVQFIITSSKPGIIAKNLR